MANTSSSCEAIVIGVGGMGSAALYQSLFDLGRLP